MQTKPALGASKPLTKEQVEQLKSWASLLAVEFGFQGQYWSRARFQLLIKETFGVAYQLRQVGNRLKNLKITWQKPTMKEYRQKADQLEEWRKERLPTIKKAGREKSEIGYPDEADVQKEPNSYPGWGFPTHL